MANEKSSLCTYFVGGTFGGMAQVLVGHPFDTIKVRLQAEGSHIYKNAFDCFFKSLKHEGITGLYRGATSPLIGIGFCNAILFATNKRISEMIGSKIQNVNIKNLTCGALAGIVMSLFNCPIELVKIKLQIRHENNKMNLMQCVTSIYREFGLSGFYRGYLMTLMRDFPSFAVYFGAFEYFMMAPWRNKRKETDSSAITDAATISTSISSSNLLSLASGGFAGIAAWCVCYPQDVMKSRLQADHYVSFRKVFNGLVEQRAFFRGFGPVLLRAFPANAATFFAYHIFTTNISI